MAKFKWDIACVCFHNAKKKREKGVCECVWEKQESNIGRNAVNGDDGIMITTSFLYSWTMKPVNQLAMQVSTK